MHHEFPLAVLRPVGRIRCMHAHLCWTPRCFGRRIQRQDMLVSAKNDAKKAIDVNSKRLYHRRRLGQTWTVLARLEVLYYPKKGNFVAVFFFLCVCRVALTRETLPR